MAPTSRRPLPPEVYWRRRWAALGAVVVTIVTVVILATALFGSGGSPSPQGSTSPLAAESNGMAGSGSVGPLPGVPIVDGIGGLPPGGVVTEQGRGTWHGVGSVGAIAGKARAANTRTFTYVVEVEDGLNTSSFGGGDSFAAMVDSTLADPRSWISTTVSEDSGNTGIAFRHISVADKGGAAPDLRIRLTSPTTTRTLCGSEITLETSCFVADGDADGDAARGRVLVNVARWVRGAVSFAGDLGSYRQYVLNHEIGHGIGYSAHQPCPTNGALAPVMMQQTLSLNNRDLVELDAGTEYSADGDDHQAQRDAICIANAWPRPEG